MNITQVSTVYFSPTGSTKRVMQRLAQGQNGAKRELDLTESRRVEPDYHFLENEVVLIGVPVYGGRIPETAANRLRKFHGRRTPAVLVVTYGNRNYDDALLELKELTEAQGFRTVAAAAVVTEHNIVRAIGSGRPDQDDLQKVDDFAAAVSNRLQKLSGVYQNSEIKVRGGKPYREYDGIPLKPKVGKHCNQCGLCIRTCPVQAISKTDATVLDTERCISCMRCLAICPAGARKLSTIMLKAASMGLKKKCKERREPEFYL